MKRRCALFARSPPSNVNSNMAERRRSYAPVSNSASVCERPSRLVSLSTFFLLLLFYDYYIFRTLSYVGNVQLVKFPSLCCLDNDYLSLSLFFSFFLCVCGGCCIVQFPSHIPHPNCGVHRETIFSPLLHLRPKNRGDAPDGERERIFMCNIYLDVLTLSFFVLFCTSSTREMYV